MKDSFEYSILGVNSGFVVGLIVVVSLELLFTL
jgi:hypothetical protein